MIWGSRRCSKERRLWPGIGWVRLTESNSLKLLIKWLSERDAEGPNCTNACLLSSEEGSYLISVILIPFLGDRKPTPLSNGKSSKQRKHPEETQKLSFQCLSRLPLETNVHFLYCLSESINARNPELDPIRMMLRSAVDVMRINVVRIRSFPYYKPSAGRLSQSVCATLVIFPRIPSSSCHMAPSCPVVAAVVNAQW
jgi:hypothetical protein